MISLIEPSPHDAGTAYVAVDRHKLDDFRPYIYKTTDYGKTWTAITSGIPDGAFVHAVREDPKRKGLLYAGTETGVFVSFDDGAHWQPLQLNLPTVPVHDLVVKNNDLVLATHGRSFWILDDSRRCAQLNPQIGAGQHVHLYKPSQRCACIIRPTWIPRLARSGRIPPRGGNRLLLQDASRQGRSHARNPGRQGSGAALLQ